MLFPLRSEWATHSCVAHRGRRTFSSSFHLNTVTLATVNSISTDQVGWPGLSLRSPGMHLKDKRTCVVKVKLEPGKTYAIWLNSEKFHNFKDADGRPAVPYLLVFQTAK